MAKRRCIQPPVEVYDQDSYPRAADSDMESELSASEQSIDFATDTAKSEFISLSMEEDHEENETQTKSSLMEEFTCVICAQMLVDPMTLHCGHSFCQLCLAQMWSNKQKAHPTRLQCPVCREQWQNFPGVNIQLRNIIEHSYSEMVQSRKSGMTEGDNKLLEQFLTVKKLDTQSRRADVQRHAHVAPELRRVVQTLLFCFAVVIALLILIFCLLLWVWAGAGGEFMRKPVTKWNSEDVADWVTGLGDWAQYNYSEIFRKEKITGTRLLKLNEQALQIIGIRSEYRRQTILQAIEELRLKEFSAPRNFHEFKAAHRKQTLLVAAFYKQWPRITFLYAFLFHYYEIFLPVWQYHFPQVSMATVTAATETEGVERESEEKVVVGGAEEEEKKEEPGNVWRTGKEGEEDERVREGERESEREGERERETEQGEIEKEKEREKEEDIGEDASTEEKSEPTWKHLLAFTVEILLIPHFLVAVFAWSWFELHPLIVAAIVIHCVWATVTEGQVVVAVVRSGNWRVNWRAKISTLAKNVLRTSIQHYFQFVFWFLVATLLWHFTPHFVCDILFYLIVWHTLYMHIILNNVLKYIKVRRERIRLQQEQNLLEVNWRNN